MDSVLSQSFGDFELVVCDDASTDDSLAIVQSVPDSRVRVLRHDANRGLFPTLNDLVGEAGAHLIRLWSQDDRMKPGCLQTEHDFWARHPEIGFAYSRCDIIDESGRCVVSAGVDGMLEVCEPWLVRQLLFYYGCIAGNIATVSFRKAAFESVGSFANLRLAGDFDMWARMARQFALGCIQEPQVDIRRHPQQLSRQKDSALEFMVECRPILDGLARDLPASWGAYLRCYRRRHHHVSYFHHAVRSILAGRFRTALAVLCFLAGVDSLAKVGFWWLLSGNRRWLRIAPMIRRPEHILSPV
jgi:glycosyltransferase involved in cell wall biosynthesis